MTTEYWLIIFQILCLCVACWCWGYIEGAGNLMSRLRAQLPKESNHAK